MTPGARRCHRPPVVRFRAAFGHRESDRRTRPRPGGQCRPPGLRWIAAESEPEAARTGTTAMARALIARTCAELGLRSDPYLDRLCLRRHQKRPLCREPIAPASNRHLRGDQARGRDQGARGAFRIAVILRTAWVYAETGREFRSHHAECCAPCWPELRVVADQQGCPTNADDLAAAVLGVADVMLQQAGPTPGRGLSRRGRRFRDMARLRRDDLRRGAARHGRSKPKVTATRHCRLAHTSQEARQLPAGLQPPCRRFRYAPAALAAEPSARRRRHLRLPRHRERTMSQAVRARSTTVPANGRTASPSRGRAGSVAAAGGRESVHRALHSTTGIATLAHSSKASWRKHTTTGRSSGATTALPTTLRPSCVRSPPRSRRQARCRSRS